MPLRIESNNRSINATRTFVAGHDNFTGKLSARPARGNYNRGASPTWETYDDENVDRHCSQGSLCSGVRWRVTEHKRSSSSTADAWNTTWETRCPFASELDGTDAGKFCERKWFEDLYGQVPEHTHD